MNTVTHLPKLSGIAFSLMILAGCQQEDAQSPPTLPIGESIAIEAHDGVASVLPNEPGYVNLESHITRGSRVSSTLDDVHLISDNDRCGFPQKRPDRLGFDVQLDGQELCQYQYTVAAQSGETKTTQSATVTVFASSNSAPMLSPIPYAIELTDSESVSNIKIDEALASIGEIYPSGYTLSSNYTILGDGQASIHPSIRTVRYTAVNDGPHRIIYQLLDPIGNDNRFGAIDISVSNGLNRPPVAQDDVVYPLSVEKGETVDIDVSPYVTSPDGDDVQLVRVESFNASVTPKLPDDLTNKVFTFNAPLAGHHYVSFVVSDHKGGFDTGLMQVEVEDSKQKAQWSDISYGLDVYSAPLTRTEANEQTVAASGSYYDGGYTPAINMATFKFSEAKAYCDARGRLPTSNELQGLHSDQTPGITHNWPTELAYWAEDSGPALVELDSGASLTPSNQSYYVTCVTEGGLVISPTQATAVADGVAKAGVEVTYTLGGEPVSGTVVSASVTQGDATLSSANETTDSSGQVRFEATSFTAGDVVIEADVGGASVSQSVTFIADVSTAAVSDLSVLSDDAKADGQDTNRVRATLTDANDNPVAGEVVTFSSDKADLVESPSSLVTNNAGQVEASFTSETEGVARITSAYADTASRVVDVNFEPICNTNTDANGCFDILDTGNGKLFTSSPSVTYLDSIGGSATDNILTENGTEGPKGDFYLFSWSNANALCDTYSTRSIGGRTNWRLATRDELKEELYDVFGNMFSARGWPTRYYYWSATPAGSFYYTVLLSNGRVSSLSSHYTVYASCVSEP